MGLILVCRRVYVCLLVCVCVCVSVEVCGYSLDTVAGWVVVAFFWPAS